jgi:hypothetical protein
MNDNERAVVSKHIEAIKAQIIAACEEAGLGPVTEPDNSYDNDLHFGGALVHVYNAAYDWQSPRYEVEVRGVYVAYNLALRAVTYKEPFNLNTITARIAKAQEAKNAADVASVREREAQDAEDAIITTNSATLAAIPHAGLSATADAGGLNLTGLSTEQFAAAVAAIRGSE